MDINNLCANRKHTKFQVDILNSFQDIEVQSFAKKACFSKLQNLAFLGCNKSKIICKRLFKTTLLVNFEHKYNV